MGERKCTARSSSLSVAQSLKKQAAAQHGGGYSYRLCRNAEGAVTEDCFQRTHLAFAEKDVQWLQHINGTKYQIPMTKFTHPVTGAEWARIPFPTCSGGGNPAGHGFTDGQAGPGGVYYCKMGTEYPEPLLLDPPMGCCVGMQRDRPLAEPRERHLRRHHADERNLVLSIHRRSRRLERRYRQPDRP